MGKASILYVEDEPTLAKVVSDSLEAKDYQVTLIRDGETALDTFTKQSPDICLLDVMLPGTDGFTLAKQIREMNRSVPILFLTAKDQQYDLAEGFASGGNDYIKKPFNMQELLLRIENLLILTGHTTRGAENRTIMIGSFTYHPNALELKGDGFEKKLSYREAEILKELYRNINNVTSRKELLLKVWGDDHFFNSRNLDVYIKKLRDYFKSEPNIQINTLKGVGYLFCVK